MNDWGPGYSQAELDDAQGIFNLRFPPDLIELLKRGRLPRGHDWTSEREQIRRVLAWPLDGLLFDVEHNALWLPQWGERPAASGDRAEVVGRAVAEAPKLIPLCGHRYIPEEPHERGNPIFSVYQSDIIYYGSNLANYIANEFSIPHQYAIVGTPKRIRFWSDFAEGLFIEAPR